MKATYRVTSPDHRVRGDTVTTKEWSILVGGERVGGMSSRITDLNWPSPMYTVSVSAEINGRSVYARTSSGSFIMSMRDAKWERGRFVSAAKEAVARAGGHP